MKSTIISAASLLILSAQTFAGYSQYGVCQGRDNKGESVIVRLMADSKKGKDLIVVDVQGEKPQFSNTSTKVVSELLVVSNNKFDLNFELSDEDSTTTSLNINGVSTKVECKHSTQRDEVQHTTSPKKFVDEAFRYAKAIADVLGEEIDKRCFESYRFYSMPSNEIRYNVPFGKMRDGECGDPHYSLDVTIYTDGSLKSVNLNDA